MLKIFAAVLFITLMSAGCATTGSMYDHSMTKDDVIALTKNGVSDDVIINQIQATHSRFQLSNDDLVALKNAGVSDTVVNAMLKHSGDRQTSGYYSPYYWDSYWYGSAYWNFGPRYIYSYPYYRPYAVYPHYTPYYRGGRIRR